MNGKEALHILAAVLVVTAVIGFSGVWNSNWPALYEAFLFAVLIIIVTVYAKKIMAYSLDTNIEHSVWGISRWGFAAHRYLKREFPAGIFVPLFFTLFSLGALKIMPVLTYEATALKVRAARRFGYYSYTTLSEWHNSLIGAAGIVAALLISFVSYFLPWELEALSKTAAYFALVNLIPLSKLDGAQIFFGSRVLWATLLAVSLIFTAYSILLI